MKGVSNTNLTVASKDNRNARNLQFERETGKAPESTNTSSSGTEGLDDDEDEETGHDDEDYEICGSLYDYEFCGSLYDTELRDKILTDGGYSAYLLPMNCHAKILSNIDLRNSDIYLVNVMIEDDDVTVSAKLLYHFNASSDEDPSFYYLESDAFIEGSFGGKIYRDSLTGSIDPTENTIDIRGSELNYKSCMIVYKKKKVNH